MLHKPAELLALSKVVLFVFTNLFLGEYLCFITVGRFKLSQVRRVKVLRLARMYLGVLSSVRYH
jgi:hypothetical protein